MVRWTAAASLGNIGPEAKAAIPALTEALKDSDPSVQQTAQIALQQIQRKP
jgi:HEAT repeat protein